MAAIQSICARIGRVTGEGLAANMARVLPRWLVHGIVFLLLVANIVNIGADLAAMGAAAKLLLGRGETVFAILLAALSLALQIFVPYHRYVHLLKWLTLALLAYVGVLFSVKIDWMDVARGASSRPQFPASRGGVHHGRRDLRHDDQPLPVLLAVARRSRTRHRRAPALCSAHPEEAPDELQRIAVDTWTGMAMCQPDRLLHRPDHL